MKMHLQKQTSNFYSKKKMNGSKYAKLLIVEHSGCSNHG